MTFAWEGGRDLYTNPFEYVEDEDPKNLIIGPFFVQFWSWVHDVFDLVLFTTIHGVRRRSRGRFSALLTLSSGSQGGFGSNEEEGYAAICGFGSNEEEC